MISTYNAISSKLVLLWIVLIASTVWASESVQRNEIAQREQQAQQVTLQFIKQPIDASVVEIYKP